MSEGFVYILLSEKDKRTYVGSTDNIERRLAEHNRGNCNATKNRRPLQLIYSENCESLSMARKREKHLKTAAGRKKMKIILKRCIESIGE